MPIVTHQPERPSPDITGRRQGKYKILRTPTDTTPDDQGNRRSSAEFNSTKLASQEQANKISIHLITSTQRVHPNNRQAQDFVAIAWLFVATAVNKQTPDETVHRPRATMRPSEINPFTNNSWCAHQNRHPGQAPSASANGRHSDEAKGDEVKRDEAKRGEPKAHTTL